MPSSADRSVPERGSFARTLGRAWKRFTGVAPERSAPDPTEGAQPINECGDRAKVVVAGELGEIEVSSADAQPRLSATVHDASGSVRLVWIGRRAINGIEAGRRIRVEGRVACRDGEIVMFNPRYELLSS